MKKKPISVLIVDDSALMRNVVSKFFDDTPDINVAATARNGAVALQRIDRFNPDIIILDLEMPEMDGITFLKERKRKGISIPVIILSTLAQRGARITMEAIALGASDFIQKPSGSISQDIHKTKDQLIQFVRIYSRKGLPSTLQGRRQPIITPTRRVSTREKVIPRIRKPRSIEVIAIGISTGGPNALREILPYLAEDLPTPILVVQHMPKGFTEEFAKSLDVLCPLSVKEAQDGDIVKPGRILIAPGDQHMQVIHKRLATIVQLTQEPPVNGHRPSVDVLFSSIASTYGNRSIALIMTGMGKDGAQNIGTIYRAGGITIAQDEPTSVVFGMPRAAIEQGVIHHVVPLFEIATTINKLAKDAN